MPGVFQQPVSTLLLSAGFGLFIFTRTTTYVPAAIVLAPIFILLFMRGHRAMVAIPVAIVGFVTALTISLWGLFPMEDPLFTLVLNTVRSLLVALVIAAPYVVDRLVTPRLGGFAGTLVFPVAAAAIYFLDASYGPLDGIGIFYAYSQYGNLPLVQVMSLAEMWGMVFLLSWTASVAVWVWQEKLDWTRIRGGATAFAGVVLALLLFGGLKASPLFDHEGETARFAAVVMHPEEAETAPSMKRVLEERLYSALEPTLTRMDRLVAAAARGGARFVVFQEYAAVLRPEDRAAFTERLGALAAEHRVYLSATYAWFPPEGRGENRSILFDDRGTVAADYQKHSLFFGETPFVERGPATPPVVDTPFGRIGLSICRDFEFPGLIRHAAAQGADIVISPAYDFPKGVTPSNTYNQMLRSVENGFSVLRSVNSGLSVATDYHGRVLASMNYFTSNQEIMFVDLPMRGIRTLYTVIGDSFAWLCVGGLAVMLLAGLPKLRGIVVRDGDGQARAG